MSITSIPESMITQFQANRREVIAKLRSHLNGENVVKGVDEEVVQVMMREAKKNLVSSSTFVFEVETGFYHTNHWFYSFISNEIHGQFFIAGLVRQAWNDEDSAEIRRLTATPDGEAISDYGLADNMQQVQEYLREIESIVGLDKMAYFVHLTECAPRDEEWRKSGPYIGEHESTANIPILKWEIYVL